MEEYVGKRCLKKCRYGNKAVCICASRRPCIAAPQTMFFFAGTRYEVRGFFNFAGKHCEGALAVIAATAAAAAAAASCA